MSRLRLAIALKAELEVLHVEPDNDQQDWKFGPHVIRLLTQWGYLGANATDDDVAALGIHVRKTMGVGARAPSSITRPASPRCGASRARFDAASIFARALPEEKLEIAALHVGPGVVETCWLEPLTTWTMLD